MRMPAPDKDIIANKAKIANDLRAIVANPEAVITNHDELRPYESDALTAYQQIPLIVVLPESVAEISAILEYCNQNNVKIVPRGAGTSLSGGALPLADGIILGLAKFTKILDIDYDNRTLTAQTGVTNLGISDAVAAEGFYYAPDPSSQIACTIGGNIAENSGGVHSLKYGLTGNNILGLQIILMDGEIINIGGKHMDSEGYDFMGLLTGSEGLLGVITEITVKLLKKPASSRALLLGFLSNEDASNCVGAIISHGIIPAGMEMMDKLAIHAVEDFIHAGYPLDCEALLIIELDGPVVEVDHLADVIIKIAKDNGATSNKISNSEEERVKFWAGRKAAFPAIGRISPDYLCMDGTIPRGKMPFVLSEIQKLSQKYDLRVANVFHAGDGNLHPLILYDANIIGQLQKVEEFGADILRLCVDVGGVLTGEHGVGVEKRDLMNVMFNEIDLKQQQRVKCVFDENLLLNPGKVFPQLYRCAELGHMHVKRGKIPFPDIPRF